MVLPRVSSVIGRERELGEVRAALDALPARSSSVVLEGEHLRTDGNPRDCA